MLELFLSCETNVEWKRKEKKNIVSTNTLPINKSHLSQELTNNKLN